MGAAGSLLTAIMQSALFIPAANCTAPEMPSVMIRLGRTVLPLSPIWCEASSQPASTSGRLHASCAPMALQNACTLARSAALFRPRPYRDQNIGFGNILFRRLHLGGFYGHPRILPAVADRHAKYRARGVVVWRDSAENLIAAHGTKLRAGARRDNAGHNIAAKSGANLHQVGIFFHF